ncbi:META domain-containing protein [Tateyamaria sp.]|uniref:META domain-containing protein n=1 Tax=Tateyamaria sp. TaxID=1929288 RepID=UPI003B20D137
MIRSAAALLIGCGTLCQADGAATSWQLIELSGTAFSASATLTIGEDGQITGRAPCNRYAARLLNGGTAFEVGPIMATKMACPDLVAETVFLDILTEVANSETRDGFLILHAATGAEMVFKPAE